MKKNGFIATSILYTFFLVFITLFVALITNYIHNQVLISAIDEASWDMLLDINNTKISDLELGDRVKIATSTTNTDTVGLLNDGNWVVAYITTSGNYKTYYFLSDLNVQNSVFKYKMSTERISKRHSMTLDVYKDLINYTKDGTSYNYYNNAIKYNEGKTNIINVTLPTLSILRAVRNDSTIDETVKNAIFNTDGDYIVYADTTAGSYNAGSYYNLRTFNMSVGYNGKVDNNILSSYCGGTYTNGTVNYNPNNIFGYMHVSDFTNTEGETTQYIDYCYFSNLSYVHYANDKVVMEDEGSTTKPGSDLIESTYSASYNLRLMGTITVNVDSNETYISGGKGTTSDPYLLIDGSQR